MSLQVTSVHNCLLYSCRAHILTPWLGIHASHDKMMISPASGPSQVSERAVKPGIPLSITLSTLRTKLTETGGIQLKGFWGLYGEIGEPAGGSNPRPADYERTARAFQLAENKGNYVGRLIDCAQIVLTCGATPNWRSAALQPGQPIPGILYLGMAEVARGFSP